MPTSREYPRTKDALKTVIVQSEHGELMGSVFAPDTLPGRPRGEAFGLSVRVVNDPVARNSFLSEGSFGWSGAFGTHFWVDRKEQVVGVLMVQEPVNSLRTDFQNAVMQAIIE